MFKYLDQIQKYVMRYDKHILKLYQYTKYLKQRDKYTCIQSGKITAYMY